MLAPDDLKQAIAALWQLKPPGPDNLFSAPAFVQLRETCQRLYPRAGSKDALSFALGDALRALGMPCNLTSDNAKLVLPVDIAAKRLDAGFRCTHSKRVYLCPLD